jgi:hypothetical protein
MATIIVLILGIACEVFLVFAFVHFRSEQRARGSATPQPLAIRIAVVRPRRAEAGRTPAALQGMQISFPRRQGYADRNSAAQSESNSQEAGTTRGYRHA